nr:hypothetical protein [Nitrospinaceae bacterium]
MAGNDINQWLSELGLSRYQGMFANNDIDFRTLPHLTEEDFRELGIFLGHRRLLMRAIADLSAATRAAGGSGQFDPREAATP